MSERIGVVGIRQYYLGLYDKLGAVLREQVDNVTHQRTRYYAVDVPVGNQTVEAKVMIGNPFPLIRTYKPPAFILNFENTIPVDLQAYNMTDLAYRVVEGDKIYTGYRGIQSSLDIFINVYAPTREIAHAMMAYFFKRFGAPFGLLIVRDTLNKVRKFSYQLTSIDDVTEVTNLFERYVGYTITLTVFCEIHYWEGFTVEDLNPVEEIIVNFP